MTPRRRSDKALIAMVITSAFVTAGSVSAQAARDRAVESFVLANGLEVVVASDHEQPWLTVHVVVRDTGGAVGGLSELVARNLTQGTSTRSASGFADTLDALGAALTPAHTDDGIVLTLGVLSAFAEEAVSLLADMVIRPTFPVLDWERSRTQALTALGSTWSDPRTTAGRVLRRTVYGPHPYSSAGRIERLAEASVTDARTYHRTVFRPANTVVVVSGDVGPSEAKELVDRHFGAWQATSRDGADTLPEPASSGPTVLVHRPGATRAIVSIGHALPAGAATDWLALEAAMQVLAVGPTSRLAERFRVEGFAASTAGGLTRRAGPGLLQLRSELSVEEADRAIGVVLEEVERMTSAGPTAAELGWAKAAMTRGRPLQSETAPQVASQLAGYRLLGLSADDWMAFPERVAALTVEDVAAAARAHFRPWEASVVVVGDATILRPRLAGLGAVHMEDMQGQQLGLDDLLPPTTEVSLSAISMTPAEWVYRITAEGRNVGSVVRTLRHDPEASEPGFVLSSTLTTGGLVLEQEVVFAAAGFEPSRASFIARRSGSTAAAELRIEDERVVGSRSSAESGAETFEAPRVEGALLGEMTEAALWLLPLEVGFETTLAVMQVQSGAPTAVRIRVLGRRRTTVPAGSFDVYLVEIAGDQGAQVAHALVRAPHVVVRLESPGQPQVLELESASEIRGR